MRETLRGVLWAGVVCLLTTGCSPGGGGADVIQDTGTQTAPDAADGAFVPDTAGTDALGSETGADASPADAPPVDAAFDAATDASADAGGEGGQDAATDADAGFTGAAAMIGAAGGSVTWGNARLVVPAGAVATDTLFTITPSTATIPSRATAYGAMLEFGPTGRTFAKLVRVEFTLDTPRADATVWIVTTGTALSPIVSSVSGNRVSGLVEHFCPSCPGSNPDAQLRPGTMSACGDAGSFDLAVDPTHCGACSRACTSGQTCVGGQCYDRDASGTVCPGAGFHACSGECRSFATDTDCGACGVACTGGRICRFGSCATPPTCGSGQTFCRDAFACFDLQSDAAHCGSCATACTSGQSCVRGTCQAPCPSGRPPVYCGGSVRCLDFDTDNANCGACGVVCGSGATCTFGTCTCATGSLRDCGAGPACIDTSSDVRNCGGCNQACSGATPYCVASACAAAPCTTITQQGTEVTSTGTLPGSAPSPGGTLVEGTYVLRQLTSSPMMAAHARAETIRFFGGSMRLYERAVTRGGTTEFEHGTYTAETNVLGGESVGFLALSRSCPTRNDRTIGFGASTAAGADGAVVNVLGLVGTDSDYSLGRFERVGP